MYRWLHAIGFLILSGGSVLAQAPAPAPPPDARDTRALSNSEATQAVLERVVTRLEKIEARLDRLDKSEGRAPVDAVSKADFDGRMAELNAKWDDLAERVRLQHRDLAEVVARDSRDAPTLRLRAMMDKSPDFRNEMSQVVRDIASAPPPLGIVRVENQMGSDQTIRVNGQTFAIPALQTADISVPVGSATTELVGYEAAKTWPIPSPGAVQKVTIYPRTTVVVQSPIVSSPAVQMPVVQQPVVVQAPVYSYW